jgi:hypothetical protein
VVFITYSTVFNGDPAHPMSRVPDNTLNLNTINEINLIQKRSFVYYACSARELI